jgi:hypothetical protein
MIAQIIWLASLPVIMYLTYKLVVVAVNYYEKVKQ